MLLRIGIPEVNGSLIRFAHERGYSILVSANRFFDHKRKRFRRPGKGLRGLNIALDSAGFVAMSKYGGYPWTVEQYIGLAKAFPWAWWASMDYCCEPEIADSREVVEERVEKTFKRYVDCIQEAQRQGCSFPMPVLQGWKPSDYLESARLLTDRFGHLPPLVGVGSVCRRDLKGPAGLLAVVGLLDDELPPHVQLHLFGVKGALLRHIDSSRIASMDSMAWDYRARRRCRDEGIPYRIPERLVEMERWYEKQKRHLRV